MEEEIKYLIERKKEVMKNLIYYLYKKEAYEESQNQLSYIDRRLDKLYGIDIIILNKQSLLDDDLPSNN